MPPTSEEERRMDAIMYVASLSLSAVRFAKGQAPFDFEDTSTAEFLMSRSLPFIEDEHVDYKIAHQAFIQNMVENGWSCGPEDFANRKHPDLIAWDKLSSEAKSMYGYTAAIICSAKDFYKNLKEDLESEFMSSFDNSAFTLGAKPPCRYKEV